MQAYGIDAAEMQPVCSELFERLRELLLSLHDDSGKPRSLRNVHVFDSAGLNGIVPATPGAPGISGDWVDEIHLTAGGDSKSGPPFGRFIDEVVGGSFGPLSARRGLPTKAPGVRPNDQREISRLPSVEPLARVYPRAVARRDRRSVRLR